MGETFTKAVVRSPYLRTLSEPYFRRAVATASGHSLWSFAVEQNALAFDAPSIAGKRTVAANDTMAGIGFRIRRRRRRAARSAMRRCPDRAHRREAAGH